VSGVLAGLAAIVAVGYWMSGTRPRPGPQWPRLAYVVSSAITIGATLAAHTRGAVLGMSVGLVVLVLFVLRGRRRLVALSAMAGMTVIAVSFATGVVTDYFVRDERPEALTTLNSRTDYWAVAFDALEREPLFGYGLGSARGLFVESTGLGGGHNAVVSVLVDLGWIGLLSWSALVVATIAAALQVRRSGEQGALIDRGLVLAVIAFLLVDGMFYDGPGSTANVGATWLFVCVGWVSLLRGSGRRRPERWVERRGVHREQVVSSVSVGGA
jgi:exopolysaccharide production protein ExoQ